ncbi:MAG: hypothetical protein Q7U36_02005 [bacterium]|nr:hypothetical protein [bacterium]
MKQKSTTTKFILVIIFCLVLGFGFGKGEKAEAEEDDTTLGLCYNRYTEFDAASGLPLTVDDNLGTMTKSACIAAATISQSNHGGGDMIWNPVNQKTNTTDQKTQTVVKDPGNSTSCSFVFDPIDCTLLTLLEFFVRLTILAGALFKWIMEPNSISSILSSEAIYGGWALVRDALNVSFIMFLLFSAFATVFQIDKYNYKNTLLKIVLMALLVNFSFPISRFIIDTSNMLMYYFVTVLEIGSNKVDTFVSFASISNLPGIMHPAVGKDTASLLAAVVFVFIFMVTMLTISVLFVIRTLALAVLIIFSSLAFVGAAVPPLAKHSSDWWKKLFDYSFFGPIMLFMMYIASSLMNEIQKNGILDMETLANKSTSDPEYIATLAFFFLPIIILWIGLGIAKEMSGSAGSAVVGKAQGFMKGTAKWLGHKADRGLASTGRSKNKIFRPLQYLSPTALKTAWKQREEELDKKAFGPATGNWRDTLNRFWTVNPKKWMNRQSRHGEAAIQSLVAQHEKDAEAVSTDFAYIYGEYKMAEKAKDKEKMAAMLRIIAKTNEFNSFSKEEGFVMDPFELKRELFKRLKKVGMQESEAGKHIADMGEIAYGKGNYQLYGMSAIDAKGNYAETSDDKQIELSRGKAKNIKAQTKTDLWHWNSFLQQDTDGNAGKLHRFGEIQLEQLNTAVLDQLNRVRDDFFDGLITQVEAIDIYANKIEAGTPIVAATATTPEIPAVKANPEQAKIIREFADRVRERKGMDPVRAQADRIKKG